MAKASKSVKSSKSSKYDMARELKSLVNQNVLYGLNAMEAATDGISDAIEGAFGKAKDTTRDTTDTISGAISQTRRAYKSSFAKMRKQAREALS